jgi:molecular chaperone GrpE
MKRYFMNLDQQNIDDQDTQTNPENNEKNDQCAVEHDQALKCLAELSMWQDQCKRISAEFENFKRRVDRDKSTWAEIAKESILLELVSFVDTFDMALQQKNDHAVVDNAGLEMVHQALLKLLNKNHVTIMTVGADFDPQFHEAVVQVASEKHTAGQIVEVLCKGFMIKDRVLRPAKVSVAV